MSWNNVVLFSTPSELTYCSSSPPKWSTRCVSSVFFSIDVLNVSPNPPILHPFSCHHISSNSSYFSPCPLPAHHPISSLSHPCPSPFSSYLSHLIPTRPCYIHSIPIDPHPCYIPSQDFLPNPLRAWVNSSRKAYQRIHLIASRSSPQLFLTRFLTHLHLHLHPHLYTPTSRKFNTHIQYSSCHAHYHFQGFAEFALFTMDGFPTSTGQGCFCLLTHLSYQFFM